MARYYSHGKLLLTGEYLVLDGAKALAIPTQFGQSLQVDQIQEQKIIWKSFDRNGNCWFETSFSLQLELFGQSDPLATRLVNIFEQIKYIRPGVFDQGLVFTATLEFPRDWGLGSSSTLINNLASWVNIDPYQLLEVTFGGSGYDIACASHDQAITFQLDEGKHLINSVDFSPTFSEHLYFVHLNKKQNSRDGISKYKALKGNVLDPIAEINAITEQMISCEDLNNFNILIDKHEQIISTIIDTPPIKDQLFNDFEGSIKSLGAWGGDFVLVSAKNDPIDYFQEKGYHTIVPYTKMVLK